MEQVEIFKVKRKVFFSVLALLMVASCSDEPALSAESKEVVSTKPTRDTPEPNKVVEKEIKSNSKVNSMNNRELITIARSDLMERESVVSANQVKLVSITPVTWRSGAVGCPKPGMHYTQAQVRGSLIVFAVGDKKYRYHAAHDNDPFYCPASNAETPMMGRDDI